MNDIGHIHQDHEPKLIWTTEICSANIINVKAGTNGYCGGDTGHGSRTYFSIEDLGGTDMTVKTSSTGFEVFLGGDCELATIIEALKFITKVLEDESKN